MKLTLRRRGQKGSFGRAALSPSRKAVGTSRLARVRADWVDVAKGIGILLVVAGHAIGGLITADLMANEGAAGQAFYLIYTFHMPLFFFLSGLFVKLRLEKDRAEFVQSVVTRVAWPYLLWSVIQMLVIASLGTLVNRPVTLEASRVVALLWEPMSQFWFLQSLLLLHMASRVIVPRFGALALLAASLVALALVSVIDLPIALAQPCRFGWFYAFGVAIGPLLVQRMTAVHRSRALRTALVCALVWALAAVAALHGGFGYLSGAAVPAALAGSAAVVAFAILPRAGLAHCLLFVGRNSMAIYLLHVLFVAGTRIALHKWLGLDDPVLILGLAITAGVVGPLLVGALAARLNAVRALGLG